MLLAGIDEAGYGPTLGPLVVGASVWRVDARHGDANLWSVLAECVGKCDARGDARLRVDDSKKINARTRGFADLERATLAFAALCGCPCRDLVELLTYLQDAAADEAGAELPWWRNLRAGLPAAGGAASFASISERLGGVMARQQATCRRLAARVMLEGEYNRRLEQTRSKAAVLLTPVLELLCLAVRQAEPGEPVLIVVDRLGGRANYRQILAEVFPQRELRERCVSEDCSTYELAGAGECGELTVTFVVDADQQHLPVALASMVAKYLREMLMTRFNAWWKELLPDLRPTAGYHSDAQRFLADIAPALPRSGLSLAQFVRQR